MNYYYTLQIKFEPSVETFNKLTSILGVEPKDKDFSNLSNNIPSYWTYEVINQQTEKYFDFINNFLDILEAKYADLENLNAHLPKKDFILDL